MENAISRICGKYHHALDKSSPYWMFSERDANGFPTDRTGQEYHSLLRYYVSERGFVSWNMEKMLHKQVTIVDHFKEVTETCTKRLRETEACVEWLDDKRKALEERLKLLEEPQKLEERVVCSEVWNTILHKTMALTLENRDIETKEKEAMAKEIASLKLENRLLKETVAELTAGKEEEDPQERVMFTSEGEEVPIAEVEKRKASEEPLPLSCYKIIKRR